MRVESIAVAGLMAALDEESEVTESTAADCAVSVTALKPISAVTTRMGTRERVITRSG